jgi:hypothetical protein
MRFDRSPQIGAMHTSGRRAVIGTYIVTWRSETVHINGGSRVHIRVPGPVRYFSASDLRSHPAG